MLYQNKILEAGKNFLKKWFNLRRTERHDNELLLEDAEPIAKDDEQRENEEQGERTSEGETAGTSGSGKGNVKTAPKPGPKVKLYQSFTIK